MDWLSMLNGLKKITMIRVGFLINFTHNKWLGGYNIIVNLIKSINLFEDGLVIDEKVSATFPFLPIIILWKFHFGIALFPWFSFAQLKKG